MKIAVMSDIHGNYAALKRCVDYALSQGLETFFFLGDYVGELAYPERTMNLLYDLADKYNCIFIRGNKENYWLNYRAGGARGWRDGDSTTGSMLYTYSRLTDRDLDFFETLNIAENVFADELPHILLCHGSPDRVNEKMQPDDEKTYKIMDSSDVPLLLCGHTHMQSVIEYNGRRVLNPGSVGVPLYSGGMTQFLILEGLHHRWDYEFVSLEYDIEKVIQDLHEVEMEKHAPYWCFITENLLRKGDMPHGTVLARAMELCSAEDGCCRWPEIPEKYWKQAIEELIPE